MLFRQLFDTSSSTYTYLLADEETRRAVLIDPVFERHARDAALIRELGLRLDWVVDTHCHADHVTGAWLMRKALGSKSALSSVYGASDIDRGLGEGDVIEFGAERLLVRETPGHTDGCLSLVSEGAKRVFTGDALLVRGTGRTDFQAGSATTLYRSIREKLFVLPGEYLVFPAHDYEGRTVSTIDEERRFNARIGGEAREEDFVGTMSNLGLPHPKAMSYAVPANLRGGRPEAELEADAPSFGPVVATYAGHSEIAAEWLAEHVSEVDVLDVRARAEFDGELGHVPGARLVPLDELRVRLGELSPSRPIVVVCQTGKRSAIATSILRQAGFREVASLSGGMVRYRSLA